MYIIASESSKDFFNDAILGNKQTSATFINEAVNTRYKLGDNVAYKLELPRAISRMNMDDLSVPNPKEFYSGKNRTKLYYFIQDPDLFPPKFLPIHNNVKTWDSIMDTTTQLLDQYLYCLALIESFERSNKK